MLINPLALFSDDHGDWRYDTVLAAADDRITADSPNDESQEMRWVRVDEVTLLTLHPSFAKSLPTFKGLVQSLINSHPFHLFIHPR